MNDQPFQRLEAAQAAAWLAAHPDALVLDAREPRHHEAGALRGALGQCQRLDGRNHEPLLLREAKTRPVFIYCYHGNASQTYARMFADFSFATVADLIGGYQAWGRAHPAGVALPPDLAAWLDHNGFADPHQPAAFGNMPLMHAAWKGERAQVEALLAQGVDLAASNGDGNNALWLACVARDMALVTRLVEAGVAIDHANLTGATCLMYAASSSKPELVRTLLALGADPSLRSQDDYSALDMAASLDCLQLLRRASRSTKPARPASIAAADQPGA